MRIIKKLEALSDIAKIYFALFAFCFFVSVWASGESFSKSFGFSSICYVVAFVIMLTASFCLRLVWQSQRRGKVTKLPQFLFGMVGFICSWTLIFSANTHNFYYISTNKVQKKKELINVKKQLALIRTSAVSTFESAKTKVTNDLEAEIKNLKDELLNPNNQGHGEVVDAIVTRIEKTLGAEIDLLSKPPRDRLGLRKYGDGLADKIREIRDKKLAIIDKQIEQLNAFVEKDEYKNVQKNLEDLVINFSTKEEKDVDQALTGGYTIYSETKRYIDQLYSEPLIKNNTTLDIAALPETPLSIESRDISYVWSQFFNKKIEDRSNFIWAAILALLFDMACFLLWYFGVLPNLEGDD
jgi:hypothetical protein